MDKREITKQELGRRLVEREILCCVSGLVHSLAQGYPHDAKSSLADLTEQAFELCTPVPDYESAAYDDGWRAVEIAEGGEWTIVPKDYRDAPSCDDESLPGLWADKDEAEREFCDSKRIEPHEHEIFEHWAITSWLREKLSERGERVGDLDNLDVWGRGCTGQAIALDSVIQAIACELWGSELPPAGMPA